MSTSYLSLVNNCITESGADLATFASDGSDFTTNTNSLMLKFKGWVSRAWKDIQQEAYDWDFMAEQAVVNIDPGFMFYTQSPGSVSSIASSMPPGTVFTVYDQTATPAVTGLVVNYVQDLTGIETFNPNLSTTPSVGGLIAANPYGAMTLRTSGTPLNVAFKPNSEYFVGTSLNSVTLTASYIPHNPYGINYATTFLAYFSVTKGLVTSNVVYDVLKSAQGGAGVSVPGDGTVVLPMDPNLAAIVVGNDAYRLNIVNVAYNWEFQYKVGFTLSAAHISIPSSSQVTATSIGFDANTSADGMSVIAALHLAIATKGTLMIASQDGTRWLKFTVTNGAFAPPSPGSTTYLCSLSVTDGTSSGGTPASPEPFPDEEEVVNITYSAATQGVPIAPSNGVTTTGTTFNCYIQGWKSFDFINGENQTQDFVEAVQEIDEKSFRYVDYYAGNPLSEVPITYIPWEVFRTQYDLSGGYPGLPRVVTKDNTGRWRFYPHPYYTVTIKFDYVRQPQILRSYSDNVYGIGDDFTDMIMWKALIYFGEYDEQPSVQARATKNYKQMLARLELKNRAKFHFLPHRMW